MFGLAFKDFLLVRREKAVILMALLSLISYAVLSSSPALALALAALPAYAMISWVCAFDYKYRADFFLNILPLSRREIVGARYVLALAFWAVSMLLAGAGWGVLRLAGIGPEAAPIGFAAATLGGGLILCGIYLFSYYLFGYQSARWASTLLFLLIGSVGGAIGAFTGRSGIPEGAAAIVARLVSGTAAPRMYGAIVGVGLTVFGFSYWAALAKYGRMEF